MEKSFDEYLLDIENLCKKEGFDYLRNSSPEKKLIFLYALYHYYNGDPDYIMDVEEQIKLNNVYGNDVHGCFEPESYDEKIVDVLTIKYVNDDFDINNAKFILNQIQTTISQIKNNIYTVVGNDCIIKDKVDSDSKEKIVIRLITNYIPKDEEEKIKLIAEFDKMSPLFDYISFDITFGDDIIGEICQLSSDKQCVEKGELILSEENNYLTYGNEKSIITNISALSLKDNYKKYGKSGLFAMNLRFYISDKKVDPGLMKSIKEKGENFWYYNNGIIIVCDDYEIKGDRLKLTNYSIVNGGQTTRMIGETPFKTDFSVSCKVIKNKYSNREDNIQFVSEVAEASNTQKPINSADIIANKPEQRILKQNLANIGVFVQIKRGEVIDQDLYKESWQKTKKDEIGQLIYAAIYQKPGTARNSKDKIFSDKKKYDLVFGKYSEDKYDSKLLKDLVIIRSAYKKWTSAVNKNQFSDDIKKGLVKNGFFFMLASILLIAKFHYSEEICEQLKTIGINSDNGIKVVSKRLFNHRIFKDEYDAIEKDIFALFELVYDKYLSRAYNQLKQIKPELVYSNFTKTDKNYQTTIMSLIYDDFSDELSARVKSVVDKVFYEENVDDENNTELLVDEALNTPEEEFEEETDAIADELDADLKRYRTETYKANGIKAYEVFNNDELKKLIEMRPKTVQQLSDYGCFTKKPNTKIKKYGQEIVNIIKSICGE